MATAVAVGVGSRVVGLRPSQLSALQLRDRPQPKRPNGSEEPFLREGGSCMCQDYSSSPNLGWAGTRH